MDGAARNISVVLADRIGFSAQPGDNLIFLRLAYFQMLAVVYLFELPDIVVALCDFGGDLDVWSGTSGNYYSGAY